MVSVAYQEAFVELLEILDNSNEEDVNKIPKKLIEYFKENASKTYSVNFDPNKEIKDLVLKKETKGLLSMIYYNYLCPIEDRKKYAELLAKNQVIYDEQLRQKYNPDNLFQNNIQEETPSQDLKQETDLVVYKENVFSKIINKIKNSISKIFNLK